MSQRNGWLRKGKLAEGWLRRGKQTISWRNISLKKGKRVLGGRNVWHREWEWGKIPTKVKELAAQAGEKNTK